MSFDLLSIGLIIVVALVAITMHEMMHAVVGYWLGDDTARLSGRISLNPLSHIDPLMTVIVPVLLYIAGLPLFGAARPVPFNPGRLKFDEFGAALAALAGPLTNLVLAFLGFVLYVFTQDNGVWGHFLSLFVTLNLGFFAFNILPIPPLDGSRVLYAFAPDFIRRGMEALERFGIIFIFALILIAGSFFGVILQAIIGFCLHVFMVVLGR